MPVFTTVQSGRVAFAVQTSKSLAGANDVTLTVDEATPAVITFTGAITANISVIFPVTAAEAGLSWLLLNSTSGAFTLTAKAATGTGVALAQTKRMLVVWDGTNFTAGLTDVAAAGAAARGSNSDITALTGITGGITMTGGLNLGDDLGGNSAASKALTYNDTVVPFPSDANVTASAAQYACPVIKCTGAGPTIQRDLILPLQAGAVWEVWNALTNAVNLRVIGSSGTGIAIAQNRVARIFCDGTNMNRLTADSLLT
jgi:hypothetical protein